ncbi:MAG: WecB/TagA/CpsF family glycosyltransferase [Candidatus Muirbacterium halophilum]|nr:WecB/TagA/CpsF family glycosyltransferase [Candidatus Muirbacterium halophilum]MCK9474678.1 WecB/TagA/CpsF family glycosyltransferase [Candidatus Muirbacterium halophilum]
MIISLFVVFIALFLLSRFLGRLNILIIPYVFISILVITHYAGYIDFFTPVLFGSIFFFFLGVTVKRYKIDLFLELIFQGLIIAAVIFLELKFTFLRNPGSGIFFLSETRTIFYTFLWIFININIMKIISRWNEIFSGIGISITLSLIMLIIKQKIPGMETILVFGLVVFSLYMWLIFSQFTWRKNIFDESIFYVLSFLTVSLSIIGTAKSLMLFSLIIPFFIIGLPFLFLLIITIFSFLRFSTGKKFDIFWKISFNRMILVFYILIFYISVITLLYMAEIETTYILLNSLFMLIIIFFVSRKIIFSKKLPEEKNKILGININPFTRKELIKKTKSLFNTGNPHYAVTLNALMMHEALNDEFYKVILNSADIQIIDGVGVLWAIDFITGKKVERISGIDYMTDILKMSEKNKWKIYLLGTTEDILEKCVENIKKSYPKVDIVGFRNGFFSKIDDELVLNEINNTKAEILLVGMGIPKQEKWIFYNLHKLTSVKLAMGVGGSFDVLSGKIKRAPKWMQKYGFEWLYRFSKEPFRFLRILKLPIFIINVLKEKISR